MITNLIKPEWFSPPCRARRCSSPHFTFHVEGEKLSFHETLHVKIEGKRIKVFILSGSSSIEYTFQPCPIMLGYLDTIFRANLIARECLQNILAPPLISIIASYLQDTLMRIVVSNLFNAARSLPKQVEYAQNKETPHFLRSELSSENYLLSHLNIDKEVALGTPHGMLLLQGTIKYQIKSEKFAKEAEKQAQSSKEILNLLLHIQAMSIEKRRANPQRAQTL